MTISPDPNFRGYARTNIRIEDPYLGKTIGIISGEQSPSMEEAKARICQAHLDRANLGARRGTGEIRKEYQRDLTGIARRRMEADGMDVERVTRISPTEVEVRCLEGGYVPVVRRVRLTDDGKVESYAR